MCVIVLISCHTITESSLTAQHATLSYITHNTHTVPRHLGTSSEDTVCDVILSFTQYIHRAAPSWILQNSHTMPRYL